MTRSPTSLIQQSFSDARAIRFTLNFLTTTWVCSVSYPGFSERGYLRRVGGEEACYADIFGGETGV